MHGIFFMELYKYVNHKLGSDMWNRLQKESGTGPKIYTASAEYPDQEMADLISAISRMVEQPVFDVQEELGEFMARDLMDVYGPLINPEWKTLDLLENTGGLIHRGVQNMSPETRPPELRCTRMSPNELKMIYTSPCKMCTLAKGLVKGFAKHYNEQVEVTEEKCMLKGDFACNISVKLLK